MRKQQLVVVALVAAITGACGEKKDATPSGPTAAPGVEMTAEMKTFLDGFKGGKDDVGVALAAYSAPGLDNMLMDAFQLSAPRVTTREEQGDRTCFTFEAACKEGFTCKAAETPVRTYVTCWKGGKIVQVVGKNPDDEPAS